MKGGELRGLAVRGAGVTLLSSGVGLGVQIVATVILARLLIPRDFGLVTMVTTFSLLFVNFGLNGFTEAVVQREEINHFLASNLFWLNVGAGLFLTVGFASAGSLLAWFYGDPLVAHIALGMSLTIIATSTSVLHLALLKRAMRFSAVSMNGIIAQATSLLVSILLAWAGWGYRALVAGAVALPFCTSVGAWVLCRWVPSLPRRVAGTASMARFAMHVFGRFSVNYAGRNLDNVLVGLRFNAQALGFYKKAYDLFALSGNLLVSSLATVAVSALSRLNRDTAQYTHYLLSALAVTAFVGMGLGADLTLVGKDVVRLLLGPRWDQSGRIFAFFGPGIGIMLLYGTHGWIHLSIGEPVRWFRWGLVELSFTGLLFLAALPWGPVGIAFAWTASFWILTIPSLWYAGRPIHLGVGPLLGAVWKYILASLLAGCACAGIREYTPLVGVPGVIGAATRIVVITVLFGALYLAVVILLHGGAAPLYRISRLLREMAPARSSRSSAQAVAAATNTVKNEAPN